MQEDEPRAPGRDAGEAQRGRPTTEYTVLTYTWADSKWSEMLKAWLDLPKEKLDGLTDDSLLWIDIFCLDQFLPDKMDTIRKSAIIYGYATKYYVIGLAIFDRVWCLAEIASVDQKKMVLVDEFEEDSFLWRRERIQSLQSELRPNVSEQSLL